MVEEQPEKIISIAEEKATKVISLSEEKAIKMIAAAADNAEKLLDKATNLVIEKNLIEKENIKLYTDKEVSDMRDEMKDWVRKEFAIKLVEKVVWGILIAFSLATINYLVPTLFHHS